MSLSDECPATASTNDLQFRASASTEVTTSPQIDWSNLYLSPEELKKEDEKHGNKLRIKTNRKAMFTKKSKYKL